MEVILRRFGYETRLLCDTVLGLASSARRNIETGLCWLTEDIRAGDSIVFYFAGHGVLVPNLDAAEYGLKETALVPSDFTSEEDTDFVITAADLQRYFAALPSGVQFTGIIDAPCGDAIVQVPRYFDAMRKLFQEARRRDALRNQAWRTSWYEEHPSRVAVRGLRELSRRPRRRAGPHGGALFPGVRAFLLSACRPEQLALEFEQLHGTPSGLFTSHLVGVLEEAFHRGAAQQACRSFAGLPDEHPTGPLTYLDLISRVQDRMQKTLRDNGFAVRQDVQLGFNVDPGLAIFLAPPEPYAERPLPGGSPTDLFNAAVLAKILDGSPGSIRKWPYVLAQLCRTKARVYDHPLDREGPAAWKMGVRVPVDGRGNAPVCPDCQGRQRSHLCELTSSEVIGETWLPPVHHVFAGIDEFERSFADGAVRVREGRRDFVLRRPTRQQTYTYSPDIAFVGVASFTAHPTRVKGGDSGQGVSSVPTTARTGSPPHTARTYDEPSEVAGAENRPVPTRIPRVQQPEGFSPDREDLQDVPLSIPMPVQLFVAAATARGFKSLRDIFLAMDTRKRGIVDRSEFEHFCTLQIRLPVTHIVPVFRWLRDFEGGEGQGWTPEDSILRWRCFRTALAATHTRGIHPDNASLTPREEPPPIKGLVAEMDTQWTMTAHDVGSVEVKHVTCYQAKPIESSDYRSLTEGGGPRDAGSVGAGDPDDCFYIRFCLSSNRDTITDDGEVVTPAQSTTNAIIPHVVHVTPVLSRMPQSGKLALEAQGGVVPICTNNRLAQIQQDALGLVVSSSFQPQKVAPFAATNIIRSVTEDAPAATVPAVPRRPCPPSTPRLLKSAQHRPRSARARITTSSVPQKRLQTALSVATRHQPDHCQSAVSRPGVMRRR